MLFSKSKYLGFMVQSVALRGVTVKKYAAFLQRHVFSSGFADESVL